MPSRHAIIALLAGCGFRGHPVALDAHGPSPDGRSDAPVQDGDDSCATWSAIDVDPCDPALGTPSDLLLSTGVYKLDTDTGALVDLAGTSQILGAVMAQPGGPSLRVLNTSSFAISSGVTLGVTGSLPLVIVAHDSAMIDGEIDVSAAADAPGAGAEDVAACGIGTGAVGMPATAMTAGGGGGGGGAFGGAGGAGGDGNGGMHGMHGAGGMPNAMASLVPLRGGCAGGAGGADSVGVGGGAAGRGGGAIEITARMAIGVTGTIAAAGGGGRAQAQSKTGGGGGGSGGAILLDGNAIAISGSLCANGGAGAAGGQTLQASDDGQPGTCSDTLFAIGGGGDDGGEGGNGTVVGHLDGAAGKNGGSTAGGGGGGGGIGAIRVHVRSGIAVIGTSAHVSPAGAP